MDPGEILGDDLGDAVRVARERDTERRGRADRAAQNAAPMVVCAAGRMPLVPSPATSYCR